MVMFKSKGRVRFWIIGIKVMFLGKGWVTVEGKVNSVTTNVN